MFQIYRRTKWLYQTFHLSYWLPFLALISYTVIGAFIFQAFERERDEKMRENYRNRTNFAMKQVLERMLEVRCHDVLLKADRDAQIHHAKEALYWFLDHLNLTQVIEERTDDTPWTWLGSMFYAGQLYTTIGYGYPTTQTTGGRVATIFYILFGIPIFLIILKDMGQLLSRGLRKLYKRMGASKRKIVEVTPIRRLSMPGIIRKKLEPNNTKLTIESKKTNEDSEESGTGVEEKENPVQNVYHAQTGFPIPIALSILLLWIIFSASLFCIWEHQWGFLTSVYFFFVSISTVGLGDIVFSNPDMMIFNFILILIGLALLSMCFNLIQASLERLLDRLLEEYIEEIEKMAEIVANEESLDEEAIPLEFKMTGNLLTLPMKKVTHDPSLFNEAKGWMAERIAENLLASRLGGVNDSDSECEDDSSLNKCEKDATVETSSPATEKRKSSAKLPLNMARYRFHRSRPLFNTIRTLDRIKPQPGDFRGMIFSKFIQSERLNRLVDDAATKAPVMITTSSQTEPIPIESNYQDLERSRKGRRWRMMRKDSNSSYSTVYTNSMMIDDESLLSAAYCDLKFDYSTEVASPILNLRSTLSIFKADDDDLQKELQAKYSSLNAHNSKIDNLEKTSEVPCSTSNYLLRHFPSESNITMSRNREEQKNKEEILKGISPALPTDSSDQNVLRRHSAMIDSGYSNTVVMKQSSLDEPDIISKEKSDDHHDNST